MYILYYYICKKQFFINAICIDKNRKQIEEKDISISKSDFFTAMFFNKNNIF